jgi:hypothetical protein
MDGLVEQRTSGSSYGDIADDIFDRYGVMVTPQTVRTRVAPHISKAVDTASRKARESLRDSADEADATRIAAWLVGNPGSTRRDVGFALDLPHYRVEDLFPLAFTLVNGYVIPAPKGGTENFTDQDMLRALKECAKALAVSRREPLAQARYEEWRRQQTPERQALLPSPIAYRRRFGTWTVACEKAGLVATELPRVYEGLSVDDIIVHLAVWLRSLTERHAGLIEANQSEYRQWVRTHPEAPSAELIRLRGTWHVLLSDASVLEKTQQRLPIPKPVGTGGRLKASRAIPVR